MRLFTGFTRAPRTRTYHQYAVIRRGQAHAKPLRRGGVHGRRTWSVMAVPNWRASSASDDARGDRHARTAHRDASAKVTRRRGAPGRRALPGEHTSGARRQWPSLRWRLGVTCRLLTLYSSSQQPSLTSRQDQGSNQPPPPPTRGCRRVGKTRQHVRQGIQKQEPLERLLCTTVGGGETAPPAWSRGTRHHRRRTEAEPLLGTSTKTPSEGSGIRYEAARKKHLRFCAGYIRARARLRAVVYLCAHEEQGAGVPTPKRGR